MDHPNKSQLRESSLRNCDQSRAFYFHNGARAANLQDFANTIDKLPDQEFRYHVSPDGKTNHFRLWINDVYRNQWLAKDLALEANLKDQHHCAKTIRDHLAWLNSN